MSVAVSSCGARRSGSTPTATIILSISTALRSHSLATKRSGELALTNWRCCLEAGDSIAHFALGYTLYELGRYHEAYRHLRYYAQIAPASAWNWCWLGKAAEAIGEVGEARAAYEQACEIEVADGDDAEEADAAELLVGLDTSQGAGSDESTSK